MNGVSVSALGVLLGLAWAAPADDLPTPRPGPRSLTFRRIGRGTRFWPLRGLSYHDVQEGLRGVINHALHYSQGVVTPSR